MSQLFNVLLCPFLINKVFLVSYLLCECSFVVFSQFCSFRNYIIEAITSH